MNLWCFCCMDWAFDIIFSGMMGCPLEELFVLHEQSFSLKAWLWRYICFRILHESSIIFLSLCVLQVAFLECSRHSGPEKPSSEDTTCALNVLCSKKPDFEKQMWVAKSSELKDQCPVRVENTPNTHDLSFPEHDSYVVPNAVSSLPWEHHTSRKVTTIC